MVSPPPKQKLPLTLDLLDQFISHFTSSGNSKYIWAAMILVFFGCLRGSELTVSSQKAFDPTKDITNADLQFGVDGDQSFISVLVKHIARQISITKVSMLVLDVQIIMLLLCHSRICDLEGLQHKSTSSPETLL